MGICPSFEESPNTGSYMDKYCACVDSVGRNCQLWQIYPLQLESAEMADYAIHRRDTNLCTFKYSGPEFAHQRMDGVWTENNFQLGFGLHTN